LFVNETNPRKELGRTWCMPKNKAIARITPVYHGKIVRVINIKNKNIVGRIKIRILVFL
jgi:hypothetical protein